MSKESFYDLSIGSATGSLPALTTTTLPKSLREGGLLPEEQRMDTLPYMQQLALHSEHFRLALTQKIVS